MHGLLARFILYLFIDIGIPYIIKHTSILIDIQIPIYKSTYIDKRLTYIFLTNIQKKTQINVFCSLSAASAERWSTPLKTYRVYIHNTQDKYKDTVYMCDIIREHFTAR